MDHRTAPMDQRRRGGKKASASSSPAPACTDRWPVEMNVGSVRSDRFDGWTDDDHGFAFVQWFHTFECPATDLITTDMSVTSPQVSL
ncbi:hypothetical protein E2562_026198 [Oryza meyeriana var. granulata]|uniref:Uncharacterized protein n=1 Tax=Oryza meyeriana var. granulata TaxID=110450 RepID=A0A6G1E123_9ORYZ|nr:hypothetical protein E2562_026198 [Oryza meyeriana var. granulata]